jgi:hypothetical protein
LLRCARNEDTWYWGEEAKRAFSEVLASPSTQAAELLRAMRSFLGKNDVMACLAMMVRLVELHRVLFAEWRPAAPTNIC